jgi:hypothetical protein
VSGLETLPDRQLDDAERRALRESDVIVEAAPLARAEDSVRHLAVQAGDRLYGAGFRDGDGWAVVAHCVAGDTDDLAAVRDELRVWATESG